MTPRPIYRWKTFWIGLIYVSLVGWAWWDNTHARRYFDFGLVRQSDFVGPFFISERDQYRNAFLCCAGVWSAWLGWHWRWEQRKRS